jgi:hypothetical protein
MKRNLPNVFHLCLYNKLKAKAGMNMIITRTQFHYIVGKIYRIPKEFKYPLLKEMEIVGLLERVDKKWIKVLEPKLNSEDTSKIYRSLGMF